MSPDRAYLALDRLERAYGTLGAEHRFADLCRRLTAASPREWRARVGAGAAPDGAAASPREALELLFEALEHNPHALAIHQAIWNTLSSLDLPQAPRRALHRDHARSRSSTSIRTSACAAAIAAPSCSGSARTATSGTRSSRSASRRPPTPKPRFPAGARAS